MFAENYTPRGMPQIMRTMPPPTPEETRTMGILPCSIPLPRFEVGQPGNDLARRSSAAADQSRSWAIPNREDIPGQPDVAVSNRGFGTQGSVDPVILGAQKTRLNDPVLSFMGTNDAPGDYRNSGCASCHVIYANDRDPFNSGPYAKFGNRGLTQNDDPTIRKTESGHPIRHEFTRKIPSSQCITCHVHNGNGFLNTYLGYMWWDEQTDGEHLYPKEQRNPTPRADRSRRPLQSRRGGVARAVGRSEVPGNRQRDEPEAAQSAVLGLPRPRLDVPEGLQARSQGQLPRRRRQGRSRSTIRICSRRRCT